LRDCGHVVVPENPALQDGRSIRLGYLRLGAAAETPTLPPLFMLAGGPGETLLKSEIFALFQPEFLGGILAKRDVIVLEHRGSVQSDPRLGCPDASLAQFYGIRDTLLPETVAANEAAAYAACATTAREAGIDLAQYTSLALAADLDRARQAFGFDRIALYGESYGTMVAQDYIKAYPGVTEAMVLDGTDPLSNPSWVRHRGIAADRALRKLDDLCRADVRCKEAYDIMGMVQAGIDMFDAGPLQASYGDPADPGRTAAFEITAEIFAGFVYGQMTGRIENAALPEMVRQMTASGPEGMRVFLASIIGPALLAPPASGPDMSSNLMHMAVVCSDDPPSGPMDVDLPEGISDFGRLVGQSLARQYGANCPAIGMPVLPAETDENPVDTLPVLILAGGLDVKTPTANIGGLMASMPQAQLVEFLSGSHVQLGEINLCAASIMTDFLAAPERQVLTECVSDTPALGFALPDGTMTGE
jgi:pimeloyl-ACP methyl ester carboxylesterase